MNFRKVILTSLLLGACATAFACQGPAQQLPQTAASAKPDSAKLIARGRWLVARGDLVRAAEYLTLALDAGADPQTILPLLMRTYVESGRFRMAIGLGEELLRRRPNDVPLRLLVATLAAGLGKATRAQKHLAHVLKIDAEHPEAHFALARFLRDEIGDRGRADVHFRRYLALAPSGVHSPEARSSLLTEVPVP